MDKVQKGKEKLNITIINKMGHYFQVSRDTNILAVQRDAKNP